VHVVVLAELVPEVGVVGPVGDLALQQPGVAVGLACQRLGPVAAVADRHRQPAHRQGVLRLLVDPAAVAHRAGQQPADPARGDGLAAGLAALERMKAVDAQRADEVGLAGAQRRQHLRALAQPFVAVEHQMPVGAGQIERGVARGAEVVRPGQVPHLRAAGRGQRGRGVGRAGVEQPHGIDPRCDAAQQALDAWRLVAGDDDQIEAQRLRHAGAVSPWR